MCPVTPIPSNQGLSLLGLIWATPGSQTVRNRTERRKTLREAEQAVNWPFPLVIVLKPLRKFGAGCRSRTDDLLITNPNQGVEPTWTYGPKCRLSWGFVTQRF